MKAHIFLKGEKPGDESTLLAKVDNLEVCPRGVYVIDGVPYQCTGQPTFYIEKQPYLHGGNHTLKSVELMVEKQRVDKDSDFL